MFFKPSSSPGFPSDAISFQLEKKLAFLYFKLIGKNVSTVLLILSLQIFIFASFKKVYLCIYCCTGSSLLCANFL